MDGMTDLKPPTNEELAAWKKQAKYGTWEVLVHREDWNRLIFEVEHLREICGTAADGLETLVCQYEHLGESLLLSDEIERLRATAEGK